MCWRDHGDGGDREAKDRYVGEEEGGKCIMNSALGPLSELMRNVKCLFLVIEIVIDT